MSARFPPRAPEKLDDKGKEWHDVFTEQAEFGFGKNGEKFIYKNEEGAFVGPYAMFQAAPETGKLAMELVFSIGKLSLPADVKETAILACGGHFQAAYELYAHENVVVKSKTLSQQQVEMLKADKKPLDLNENCSIAYDTAKYLISTPGPLPQEKWKACVDAFDKDGTLALIHYIGFYSYLCIALNAGNIEVPGEL